MKQFAGKIRRQVSPNTKTRSRIPEPDTDSPLRTAEAPQPSIVALQSAIGNSAVRRMISRTPDDTADRSEIQRKIDMTSANLSGKKAPAGALGRLKDNATLSTFRKIETRLDKYHMTPRLDVAEQYEHVKELIALTDNWLGDTAHLTQSDQAKHDSITALNAQAKAEYPKVLIGKKIGLPLDLIETVSPADVNLLAEAVELLEVGKGQSGMAMLTKAKPGLGNAGTLIEAFVKRTYVGLIDPGMHGIMNDPGYKEDKQAGPAAISTMKSAAQAKLDRFNVLDAQQKAAVAELMASKGAKKQDDFPILNATDPLCFEYGRLRMQRAQFESIVNGQAVADKRKNEFKDFSDAEMTGLIGYTSDLYGQVNTPLRSEVGGAGMAAGKRSLIGATVSGLNKLKPYKGTVYRHANDFTGYAETHRPGATVSDMAFLSTAKEQKGCASAAENHGSLEILISKSGKDVSKASVFGDKEAEILFRPGTKFLVTHVISRNRQKWGQKHDDADWGPQNSPKFREAMDYIKTEPAFINNFHHIVFKTEV